LPLTARCPVPSRRPGRAAASFSLFLSQFVKHPAMVSSIMPSSGRVIRRMLAPIDWSQASVVVEYGPGIGTFTRPLLDRLPAQATLIAIDTNPAFIAHLRRTIADPRLRAVQGSAADVTRILAEHGFSRADHIVSGMPFANLPPGVADAIGDATVAALRPGGAFLVYLYSPRVHDYLAPRFARIDHAMEWWNLPPAQLYWAWADA
jgi:phospholipid N-methyltransferase